MEMSGFLIVQSKGSLGSRSRVGQPIWLVSLLTDERGHMQSAPGFDSS